MALRMPSPTRRVPLVALASVAVLVPASSLACFDATTAGSGSGTGTTGSVPSTSPPVIGEIDVPVAVTATGAYYIIDGSITYSDSDDVVTSGAVQVPVIGKTIPIAIAPQFQQMQGNGIPIQFQVSDDIPLGGAGPTTFIVTLTNSAGATSAPYDLTIDLQ